MFKLMLLFAFFAYSELSFFSFTHSFLTSTLGGDMSFILLLLEVYLSAKLGKKIFSSLEKSSFRNYQKQILQQKLPTL